MTFGSAYTGLGGFDLGLTRAGWQCRWQAERQPDLRAHLARHWPQSTQYATVDEAARADGLAPVEVVYAEMPSSWEQAADAIGLAFRVQSTWLLLEGSPAPSDEMLSPSRPLVASGWRVAYRVLRYATESDAGRSCIRQRVCLIASQVGNPSRVCARMRLDRDTPLERPPGLPGETAEQATTTITALEEMRGFARGWTDGLDEATARRALSEASSPWLGAWFAQAVEAERCAPAV